MRDERTNDGCVRSDEKNYELINKDKWECTLGYTKWSQYQWSKQAR